MSILQHYNELQKASLKERLFNYIAKTPQEMEVQRSLVSLYDSYHTFHGCVYSIVNLSNNKRYVGKAEGLRRIRARHNSLYNTESFCNTPQELVEEAKKNNVAFMLSVLKEDHDNTLDEIELVWMQWCQLNNIELYNNPKTYKYYTIPSSSTTYEWYVSFLSKYYDIPKNFLVSNECWNFKNKLDNYGYGRIFFNKQRYYAHRLSKIFFERCLRQDSNWQPIHGLVYRHLCNNSKCGNPHHGVFGTQSENVKDRRDSYKISRNDVENLREKYIKNCLKDREKILEANRLGVSKQTIIYIVTNKQFPDSEYQIVLDNYRKENRYSKYVGVSITGSNKKYTACVQKKKFKCASEIEAATKRDNYIIENNLWTPENNIGRGNNILLNKILFPEDFL